MRRLFQLHSRHCFVHNGVKLFLKSHLIFNFLAKLLEIFPDFYQIHQMVSRIFCNYEFTNFARNQVCLSVTKGHLISKCLFGVFKFFQKMNGNKSAWGIKVILKGPFLKFSFPPKSEQKYFCISALAYKKRPNQKNSVRESK